MHSNIALTILQLLQINMFYSKVSDKDTILFDKRIVSICINVFFRIARTDRL